MMTRRISWVGAIVVVLALAAFSILVVPRVASAGRSHQPASSVLSHARRIADLNKNQEAYCWLPQNRVLLVYNDGKDYSKMENTEAWQGYAEILDLKTGQRQRLVGFTQMLNKIEGIPYSFEISPDGTWLKWLMNESMDGWPIPEVAHFDGSHFQRFSQDKFSVTYWIDNHRWAEQETRPDTEGKPLRLIVHNVDRPQETLYLPLKSQQAQDLLHLRRNPPAQIPMFRDDGQTFKGNYFDRYSHPTSTHPIRLPKGIDEEFDVALQIEPKYKTLAYLLPEKISSAPSKRSTKRGKGMTGETLWVCRVDGTALHRLGSVPGRIMRGSLQWMPDGKHLSFIYRNTLYVVSAEAGK